MFYFTWRWVVDEGWWMGKTVIRLVITIQFYIGSTSLARTFISFLWYRFPLMTWIGCIKLLFTLSCVFDLRIPRPSCSQSICERIFFHVSNWCITAKPVDVWRVHCHQNILMFRFKNDMKKIQMYGFEDGNKMLTDTINYVNVRHV